MPTTEKYINLLTDFGFKKLFGTEANKDLLIDFLNLLLPDYHQIHELTYMKNEQLGETEASRRAVFDIFCKSKNGEYFIVELQRAKQKYFKDRSIFYSVHPIESQAPKGEWDFQLTAVYTIAILDFVFPDYAEEENFIHKVQLKDAEGNVFYDKLTYIYIELPKFKKTIDELETQFEKWLFAFRWLSKLQKRPQALQERVFQKLFKIAEIAKFTPMEKLQYEESLKHMRDFKNVMDYAKEESKEEGREEGREEGKREQILESVMIGLTKEIPLETIAIMNNLTMEELQEIIKKLK